MQRTMRSTVAALALVVALGGCIAIKEPGRPDPGRRDNIDEHAGDAFRVDVSTQEDVLLALGEPAAVAADGSWVEYRNERNFGHWSVFGCGYYTCGGFDTEDKIRQRTLTVFFDSEGHVREIVNTDKPSVLPPDSRMLEQRVRAVTEPDEAIVERLLVAQWRVADRWRPGAIVVTDRAIFFFEIPESGPLYRLALKVPAAEIESVGWIKDSTPSGEPYAVLHRRDGRREAFALAHLPRDGVPTAPGIDRERTQHLIDMAGWMGSRGGGKRP